MGNWIMARFVFALGVLLVASFAQAQTQADANGAFQEWAQAHSNAQGYRDGVLAPQLRNMDDAQSAADASRRNCWHLGYLWQGDQEYQAGAADEALCRADDILGLDALADSMNWHALANAAYGVQNWGLAIERWGNAKDSAEAAKAWFEKAFPHSVDAEAHYLTAEALYALGAPPVPPAP